MGSESEVKVEEEATEDGQQCGHRFDLTSKEHSAQDHLGQFFGKVYRS